MTLIAIVLLIALIVIAFKLKKKSEGLAGQIEANVELQRNLEKAIESFNTADAERERIHNKYSRIIDIEEERDKIKKAVDKLKQLKKMAEQSVDTLETKKSDLQKQILTLEESLTLLEVGVYQPKFDYDTSDEYKKNLERIYAKISESIKTKTAVDEGKLTMNGSEAEGRKMMANITKLMLRAFNGECDACIAKVKWDNADRMIERIRNAYKVINKASESYSSTITAKYLKLRLDELYLTHELEIKKNDEREEQRRIKEQMREEERARREIEKAQEDAEKEEARYQSALEKAKADLEKANDGKRDALQAKIAELEAKLTNAHEMKERAISRAQMTKSGHVYIISNIGSFGEDVVKIGMTRRLEPLDRVKELGDASVPFEFDVHGLVYSENAPELENRLHKAFAEKRVNLINLRKEFFNLNVEEVHEWAQKNKLELQLTKLAEAREWRESVAIRAKGKDAVEEASRKLTAQETISNSVIED